MKEKKTISFNQLGEILTAKLNELASKDEQTQEAKELARIKKLVVKIGDKLQSPNARKIDTSRRLKQLKDLNDSLTQCHALPLNNNKQC